MSGLGPSGDRSTLPLAGVQVLDLSRVVSGPLCGRLLADLGADVIKVEPPEGDVTRTAQPFVDGVSPYFAQMNAGKRAISIDLKNPDGVAIVEQLAARADVLLENFRPGVLTRLGLEPRRLREINPGPDRLFGDGVGTDRALARPQSLCTDGARAGGPDRDGVAASRPPRRAGNPDPRRRVRRGLRRLLGARRALSAWPHGSGTDDGRRDGPRLALRE